MNKKLHFLFGSAIVVVLLVVGLWTSGLASNNPTTADQDTEVTVTISTEEELVNDTVSIASDTSLMELMQQHYDIIVTDEGFIKAIEGVEQDPENNLFWIYEVNDERSNESADDFIPEEDDRISWQLIAF